MAARIGLVFSNARGTDQSECDYLHCGHECLSEEGREWQQAVGTLPELYATSYGLAPNVLSYSAVQSVLVRRCGEWQQALGLFSAMFEAQINPDVVSYSAVISACQKRGEWQQAISLFRAMPQARITPDVISYNAVISTCEKGGAWQQALALFLAMPKAQINPDVISYNAVISACEKRGEWQQALALFLAMPVASNQSRCYQLQCSHQLSVRRGVNGGKHWPCFQQCPRHRSIQMGSATVQ